jgi:hypothetical protein
MTELPLDVTAKQMKLNSGFPLKALNRALCYQAHKWAQRSRSSVSKKILRARHEGALICINQNLAASRRPYPGVGITSERDW